MNLTELNEEIFMASDSVVKVTRTDTAVLLTRAQVNRRSRCRLLMHRSKNDLLHEMLIVHRKGQYIRPHKNVTSSKSFTVIGGSLECIIFSEDGEITDHFRMGDYASQDCFLVRLSDSCFHTLIPLTESVVFIETILGPFQGTTYAPWAPEEDGEDTEAYFQRLCEMTGIND